MLKDLLKRFMIAEDKLMHNKMLAYVTASIRQHNVWHLNRRSASRGVFIGLFFAFTPIPFQMVPAAFFCILTRANLPLSVALVWITNPITMPAVAYVAYQIGTLILGTPTLPFHFDWNWVNTNLPHMWRPLILGFFILAVSLSCIGYAIVDILWRWTTIMRWKKRKLRKKNHS